MSDNASAPTTPTPLTLLGLGAMGTALARTWLAAGHPLTIWNRSPGRSTELALRGARVAATAADAVAASPLVVTCLLNDASVREALADADLTGKDLVDLTTSTPAESHARAVWAAGRGARFLDGGIMAVPPMIGAPDAGGYVSTAVRAPSSTSTARCWPCPPPPGTSVRRSASQHCTTWRCSAR